MKNKKWSLEVALLSGIGVNQVKVGEVMGDFKDEDKEYFDGVVRDLIAKGDTREYKENVVLKLGEFEGETIEDAYSAYFDAFEGDDQNELFFMNQINAVELASCACGGNCSSNNMDKLKESKALLDSMTDEQRMDYLNGDIPTKIRFVEESSGSPCLL